MVSQIRILSATLLLSSLLLASTFNLSPVGSASGHHRLLHPSSRWHSGVALRSSPFGLFDNEEEGNPEDFLSDIEKLKLEKAGEFVDVASFAGAIGEDEAARLKAAKEYDR